MSSTCPLKQAAREAPQQIFLRLPGSTITYAQFDQLVEAQVLFLDQQNIKPQDRVAVFLPPGVLFLSLLFATLRLGALFAPLNLRLPPSAVEEQLERLSPSLFISSEKTIRRPHTSTPLPPSSLLLFTSGSTGKPKICCLTMTQLLASAISVVDTLQMSSADQSLLSLPLYHVGGLGVVFRSVLARSSIALPGGERNFTHVSCVPTHLYRAWPYSSALKAVLLGGAPIHSVPDKLPVVATYGMTETASMIFAQRQPSLGDGVCFLGFPLRHAKVRLGPDGEISVQGSSLFSGYLEGEKRVAPPEWFPTKDLALFDPKRGFAIVGRKDRQFISGGENIQPEEIEQALYGHPQVLEAVVRGEKDAEFGIRPIALIRTLDPLFSPQELRSFLLERLPKYKIPVSFFSLNNKNYFIK